MAKERNWKEKTVELGNVWDRENPAAFEGKLVKVEENIGPNESMMYTFEVDGDELKAWGSTVLDDKLLGVPIGTFCKIECRGRIKAKKGGTYYDYGVFIDQDSLPTKDKSDGEEPVDLEPPF